MKLFLYTRTWKGNTDRIRMCLTEKAANKRLIESNRQLKEAGYKVVSDEKRIGEYRYMRLSRKRDDGYYDYAYSSYSLEQVYE